MGDGLGVDLGTTSTVAAVHRRTSSGGRTELVQLGTDAYSVPSVVSMGADGAWIAGDAAERRLTTHPRSTVREYKRRFGDPAPIVIDGAAHQAEALTVAQLADVIQRAERAIGVRPIKLALAHPAAWGPFRLDALRGVARSVGYDDVLLVAEPVAAAIANRDRLSEGAVVAVYDLGGGTFDAAVVRCEGADSAWTVIGVPEGVERLGGTDIDQAVMGHVDATLGGQVFALDSSDADARTGLIRLRDACRQAKEHLSEDTDVEIPVDLPNLRTSVRLTRAELEGMIRPRLADSLAVLDRVVASAGVTWEGIDAVLLVGGSSRIPAVAQLVQERFGRPVMTATNPQLAVALGTAAMLADPVTTSTAATPAALPPPANPSTGAGAGAGAGAHEPTPASPPAPAPGQAVSSAAARESADRASRRKVSLIVSAVLTVVAAVVTAVVLTRGGDEPAEADEARAAAGSATTAGAATDNTAGPAITAAPVTTDAAAAPAPTTAPTAVPATPPTTAAGGSATGDPGGSAGGSTDLAALGLEVVECAGPVPAGITGLAAEGDQVLLAAGGTVVAATVASDATCTVEAVAAPLLVPGAFAIDSVGGGLVAVASPEGGSVVAPDGSIAECAVLAGSVAGNGEGLALVWNASGRADRLALSAGGCEVTQADTFPDFEVAAATFRSANGVVVAGRSRGSFAVYAYQRRNLEWEQRTFASADDPPYESIDALVMCGPTICVVDATAGRLHLIDVRGEHLGSAPLAEVLGEGAVFTAMTDTTEGALITAQRADGTTLLVQITSGSGN